MDNYRLIMQVGPDSWILTAWQRLGQDEVNVKQLQKRNLWHIFFPILIKNGLRSPENIFVNWTNSHGPYDVYSEKDFVTCLQPSEIHISETAFKLF